MFFDDDDLFAEMGTMLGLNPKKGCTVKYSVPSFPPANIFVDEDNNFCLNFALAGYDKEDLDISFNGDIVIVSTTEEYDKKETPNVKKSIVNNIKKTHFKYSYLIPEGTDKEKTTATFKNGMLSIVIPAKKAKEKQELSISIK